MPSDVLITPASSKIDFTDGSNATKRLNISGTAFSFNSNLNVLSSTSLSSAFKAEGVNGTLFEVTDDLSNSLMSVNTIGGLPVFEVFANNSIIGGQYGANDFVISGNKIGLGYANPVNKLSVSGSVSIGSSYNVAAPSNGLIVQGDVGIGVTSFAYSNANRANLEMYGSGESLLALRNSTGNSYIQKSGADFYINNITNGFIAISNNGSERWRITSAGVFESNNAQTIRTSTGDLTLATNAGNGHVILSPHGTGNVGIGVTSPRALLDLAKANNVGQVLLLGEVGANIRVGFGLAPSNAGMRIFSLNHITDGLIEFGGISSSDGSTWTRNHRLGLAGANSFFNEQGGNVGIGTINPVQKLELCSIVGDPYASGVNQDGIMRFSNTTDNAVFDIGMRSGGTGAWLQSTDKTNLGVNYPLLLNPNGGNVSIGALTTANKLHVNGSVSIGSNYNTAATTNGLIVEGNVGIGVTGPTAKLDVAGTNVSGYSLLLRSGDNYNQTDSVQIAFGFANQTNYRHSIRTRHNPLAPIGGVVGNNIDFYVWKRGTDAAADLGSQFVMTMQGDGNVGIGTSSPNSKLEIYSTANEPAIRLTSTATATKTFGLVVNPSWAVGSFHIYDYTLDYSRLQVASDGNVGIGVGADSPNSKVHIISDSRVLQLQPTTSTSQFYIAFSNDNFQNNRSLIGLDNSAGNNLWASGGAAYALSIGTVDSRNIVFATANNERVRINTNGNVGIGTTSPSNRLDSAINIASSDYLGDANVYALAIKNYDATAGNAVGMTFGHGGYSYTNFVASIRTGTGANPKGDLVFGGRPADGSTFTENMRLKAGGNVGIGTANPGTSLEIYATPATSTTLRQMLIINTDFASASGTGFGGSIVFRGRTAGNLLRDNAQITAYNEDIGDNGYALGFFTRPSDGGGLQQRLTILRGGNVGIATLSPANKLAVLGSVSIGSGYNTAAPTNGLIVEGSIGAGTTSPDLKVHIDAANAYPASSGTTPTGFLTLRAKTAGGTHGMYMGVANASPYGSWIQCSDSTNLAANYPLLLNPNGGSVGIGLTNPSYKLDVGAVGSGSISVRLTPGYERVRYYGFDLLGYNDGNLWMMGNNPTNTLLLSNNWDWDYQIAISYTPSTIGAAGGSLEIGQMTKNNANFTHGNTRFYTNGIERLRIINNGNVGIGISSPAARLHVNSTTSGATLLRTDGTNGTLFSVVDDLSDSLMSVNNSAGLPVLEVFADDRVVAGQYGANDFVLVNNKLGLGTNNPQYELDIVGPGTNAAVNIITRIRSSASSDTFNTGSVIAFTNTTTNVNAYSYIGSRIDLGSAGDNAQALIFATNATNTLPTEKMRIKSDGNVGIGTVSPTAKLESYFSSNAITFNYLATNLNINSPIPVYGFDVTSGVETRSIKAGIGYERHIENGRGTLHIYNRSSGDTSNISGNRSTAGDIKMSIDNSGNVGIGITVPTSLLDVNGIAVMHYEEGQNQYSFRGANRAINDWDYSGLTINPTNNDYGDGSWYIDAGTSNTWDIGILSKRRFRRVEGLTLEYETFTQANVGSVYTMIGFVGGTSASPSYNQTPTNLIYQNNDLLGVYTNGGDSGTDYSFDTRNTWWRFKTVLKSTGALHYVYRNSKWNLIKETSTNNQNDYEYVRVLFSLFRQRVYIRDLKVYVAQQSYRGANYIDNVVGNLSVAGYLNAGGQTVNGESFYQWEGATYRNPADHTPRLLLRKDNSSTEINGFAPALALYNNNGGDQTTVGMVFVSAEAVSPTQGNAVNLAGIIAKKESIGTAGGWSKGSLNFFVKDHGSKVDALTIQYTGKVGIGTTTPATLLQIGTGTPTADTGGIQFGSDTAARIYRVGASTIQVSNNLTVGGTITGALTGNVTGNVTGSSGSCTGNAATATKLFAGVNINGTSFDGSAAITTANWGTTRSITIGATAKNVNGGTDVSWTVAEVVGYTPAYGTAAYQSKSLDAVSTPGLYQYDGAFAGTKPPDNSANYRTIEIGSSSRFSQIAMPWNSDGYYFRRHDGTSFSAWRTVIHDGNYTSYPDATKLPLAGGTLTGALLVNSDSGIRVSYDANSSYAWLYGYGVEFGRTTSYARPNTNRSATLFVGGASINNNDWLNIDFYASGRFNINDNIILHAANYNSYALPLAGGTTTGMVSAYTTFSGNDDWQNSPISIRERALVGNAQSANTYAPNLNFHWASRVSKSLWLDANGILNFGEYDSSGNPAYDGYFRTDTIHAASKIGVGIASPTAKLNVLSSTSLSSVFKTEGVNGTLFEVTDDLSNSLMSVNTIGGLPVFEVFANNSVIAGQYGQNDFVISGNKVGIGTASPVYKLDVVSGSMRVASAAGAGEIYFGITDNANIYLKRDNNYDLTLAQDASSNNGLYLAGAGNVYVSIDSNNNETDRAFIVQNNALKAGTELFRVQENGNVGIGTVSPSQILDVRGNIKLGADNAGNYIYYVKNNEGTIIRTERTDATQVGLFRSDGWGNFTVDKSIGIGYSLGSNFASSTIGNGNLYVAGSVGIGTTAPAALLQIGTGTPTAATGGIQFGGDTGTRLYRSASGIVTCSGTIAATFSGNLTGNVTGNVTGSSGSAGYLTGGDSAFYAILYNTTSADLNTFNTAGLHSAEYTGSTNNPTGSVANGHFIQISDAGGTDVKTQWYYNNAGSDIYMRLMWGNGTWRSWRKLLHDGNYNSYAPTLTGTGASGSWSISVTGSSGSCTGNAANVTGTVAIANGGSGQTSAQAAMNAFAGAVTSGSYLRGNGTNVVMSAIQAADVPTLNQNTTGSSGSCTGNAASATNASQLGGAVAAKYVRTDTDGTAGDMFSLVTVTKSLTVTTSWIDTGISAGSDLFSGAYILTLNVDNYAVSGGHYNETYTGIMYWYAGGTNSVNYDEIPLHKSGHAPNGAYINLRTLRGVSGVLKLQIISSVVTSGASNYIFKFRRMI